MLKNNKKKLIHSNMQAHQGELNNQEESKDMLSKRIKTARQEMGLSQKDLGKALMLSDKTISAYEQGRVEPTADKLKKIGKITHRPISYFFDESDPSDIDLQIKLKKIEAELLEVKALLLAR